MPDRNNPSSRGRVRDIAKSPSISKDDTPKEIVKKIDILKKKFKTLEADFTIRYNDRIKKMQEDEILSENMRNEAAKRLKGLDKRVESFEKKEKEFYKYRDKCIAEISEKNKNIELQHKDINTNIQKIKEENSLIKEVKEYISQSLEETEAMKDSAISFEETARDNLESLNRRKMDSETLCEKLEKEISTTKEKYIWLDRLIKEQADLVYEADLLREKLEEELEGIPAIKKKLEDDRKEIDMSLKKIGDTEILQASKENNINKRSISLDSKEKYLKDLRKEIDNLKR